LEPRPTDSTKLRYSTDVDLGAVQWAAVGVFGGGAIDKINPKAVLAWSLVGFVLVSASRSIAAEKALVAYYAFDEGSGTVAGEPVHLGQWYHIVGVIAAATRMAGMQCRNRPPSMPKPTPGRRQCGTNSGPLAYESPHEGMARCRTTKSAIRQS